MRHRMEWVQCPGLIPFTQPIFFSLWFEISIKVYVHTHVVRKSQLVPGHYLKWQLTLPVAICIYKNDDDATTCIVETPTTLPGNHAECAWDAPFEKDTHLLHTYGIVVAAPFRICLLWNWEQKLEKEPRGACIPFCNIFQALPAALTTIQEAVTHERSLFWPRLCGFEAIAPLITNG